jgi:hypothetical protein
VEADEFGRTPGIHAVMTAEANPTEGCILGGWAGIILDSADGRGFDGISLRAMRPESAADI